jgi:anthranilate/para-aminobenzoate synthase component II
VIRHEPVHGKTTTIGHDGAGVYAGLPQDVVVGRYHSLVVAEDGVPEELVVTSRGGDVIMGLRHRDLPVEGVQFHPESVLTEHGLDMLRTFVAAAPA